MGGKMGRSLHLRASAPVSPFPFLSPVSGGERCDPLSPASSTCIYPVLPAVPGSAVGSTWDWSERLLPKSWRPEGRKQSETFFSFLFFGGGIFIFKDWFLFMCIRVLLARVLYARSARRGQRRASDSPEIRVLGIKPGSSRGTTGVLSNHLSSLRYYFWDRNLLCSL